MRIEVEIHKSFPGFSLDVELSCASGILVLFGPSGAGKSLTLQCLAGIVRPDRGRIVVGDRTLFDSALGIDEPPQRRRIGYVPQNYALFPHMTVVENISFGLRRRSHRSVSAQVDWLVEMLHLQGLEGRRPAELSGGQQQRVALARALAIGPDLLLLDEPFSALDAPLRDALREDLAEVHRETGVGIVFVTHGVVETHLLSQTVAVYQGGRVLQVGSPAELFRHPSTPEVALLTGTRNLLPGCVVGVTPLACWVDVGGVRLRAPAGDVTVGEQVLVAIRPECARFLAESEHAEPTEEVVEGVYHSAASQGHLYSVQVALGGTGGPPMQLLSPVWWWDRHGGRQGERCRVALPLHSVHVLPQGPRRSKQESAAIDPSGLRSLEPARPSVPATEIPRPGSSRIRLQRDGCAEPGDPGDRGPRG